MKAHICNICLTQAPIDASNTYDLPPTGWYTVSKYLPVPYVNLHICGPTCLATYASQEATHG